MHLLETAYSMDNPSELNGTSTLSEHKFLFTRMFCNGNIFLSEKCVFLYVLTDLVPGSIYYGYKQLSG